MIDKEKILNKYMDWVNEVSDLYPEKEKFYPKEIVNKICDLVEEEGKSDLLHNVIKSVCTACSGCGFYCGDDCEACDGTGYETLVKPNDLLHNVINSTCECCNENEAKIKVNICHSCDEYKLHSSD